MKAYENISMSYYYMGNMQKACYYMNRIVEGIYEPDDSVIKRVSFTMLKNNREKLRSQGYRHIIEEFERNAKCIDYTFSKNTKQKDKSKLGKSGGLGMLNKTSLFSQNKLQDNKLHK